MPKSSFSNVSNGSNMFTRKWGGSSLEYAVDPYITGYHFIFFSYVPPKLIDNIKHANGPDRFNSNAEVKNFLHSSCLSVTLPGGTLNKAEFNGLGNTRYAVPSNVDYDNTCTIRFLEFSGLPVLAIFHGWTRMIRDYRAGVSTLAETSDSYTKSNYAASMYYWTTQPNGLYVEEFELLTGMFPQKDPRDQYGHDLTSIDKLEVDIDFNVDTMWHEGWVKDQCQSKAETYYGAWGGLDGGAVASQGYGVTDGRVTT